MKSNWEVYGNDILRSRLNYGPCFIIRKPMELDELAGIISDAAIESAEDAEPDLSVENDSIGAYEYWGSKEYDHRPDYLICEGNKERAFVTILFPRMSSKDLDEVLEMVGNKIFTTTKTVEVVKRGGRSTELEINLEVHLHVLKRTAWGLTCEMEWHAEGSTFHQRQLAA